MLKIKPLFKRLTLIPLIAMIFISLANAQDNNQAIKKRVLYKGTKHSYIYFEPTKIRDKKRPSDLIIALHNDGQDGFDFLQKSGLHELSLKNDLTIMVLNANPSYNDMDTLEITEEIMKYYSLKINSIKSRTLLGFGSGGDIVIEDYCSGGSFDSYISVYGAELDAPHKSCKNKNANLLSFSSGKDTRLIEKKLPTRALGKVLSNEMNCSQLYTFSENDIIGGKIDFDTYDCDGGTEIKGVHVENGLGKWGKSDLFDNKYHNSEITGVDYNMIIADFLGVNK